MDRRKILLVVAVLVAAAGAGLVLLYVQDAEQRAADGVTTQEVLVVTQLIPPGESASDAADAGKVELREVPAAEVVAGATDDGTTFADTIALTTIYPGEQLLTQKFGTVEDIEGRPTLPIPAGKSAITLQMTNATRVTSFTQPGSHVAVYYVPPAADGVAATGGEVPASPASSVVEQPACAIESDVLVLGVGSTSIEESTVSEDDASDSTQTQDDVVGVVYLTIAVDSRQAARLVPFQLVQEQNPNSPILSFALRNDASDVRNTQGCADYLAGLDDTLELVGQPTGEPAGTDG